MHWSFFRNIQINWLSNSLMLKVWRCCNDHIKPQSNFYFQCFQASSPWKLLCKRRASSSSFLSLYICPIGPRLKVLHQIVLALTSTSKKWVEICRTRNDRIGFKNRLLNSFCMTRISGRVNNWFFLEMHREWSFKKRRKNEKGHQKTEMEDVSFVWCKCKKSIQ